MAARGIIGGAMACLVMAGCRSAPVASAGAGDELLAHGGGPAVGIIAAASADSMDVPMRALEQRGVTASAPAFGGVAHLEQDNHEVGLVPLQVSYPGLDWVGKSVLANLERDLRAANVAVRPAAVTRVRVTTKDGKEWGLVDAVTEAGKSRRLVLRQFDVGQDSGTYWLLDERDVPVFVIEVGIGNADAWLNVWSADDPLDWDRANDFLRCVLAHFAVGDATVLRTR